MWNETKHRRKIEYEQYVKQRKGRGCKPLDYMNWLRYRINEKSQINSK